MKILPGVESKYEESKAETKAPDGNAIYDAAEQWADLMETIIEPRNLQVSEMAGIAKSTYHGAQTEGLTGLMHNLVVETLFRYWVYGKLLNQALQWSTVHRVEPLDYKARLQQLERRILKFQKDENMQVAA
jgi:hypothetical protein